MQESEIWITRLTNDHFAGFANSILGLVGIHSQPRPWADSMVMQLLVALILVVVFAILRMRLSADRPGKLQQTFALVYEFVQGQARVLSLTVRLYANMFAGEQVTLVFLNLTYLVAPVIFMGLHVFVGVIQAYIFMLLAMAYVGGAVAHEH